MENKLQSLTKYRRNVALVDFNEIDINTIPKNWLNILKTSKSNNQLKKVIDLWRSISGVELRNTISYLSENLVDRSDQI